jgi:beta-galactosidase GanA
MPTLINKNGRHTLFVDGKPYLILGGQAHNSSAWPSTLPQVWTAIQTLHANTLEIPIYWEQIEPEPGKFDFSLIDTLLDQAREHHTRLILLWFATWKNGSNHYMPAWMKLHPEQYPNCTGANGAPIDSPSPNSDATLEADKTAFTAVMRFLKKADPQHTVIMIQVENEPGAWGTVRDYSPAAQRLFNQPVPGTLLKPEILAALGHPSPSNLHPSPGQTNPTWEQVFGSDADEYFHAWSVASFIGQVAAAGKAEYPLPQYVNAALRDPLTHPAANTYESGGPTDNVIPIWKIAAPAIDILSPDIYLNGDAKILKVIDLYTRPDNPLLVPEAGLTPDKVKYLYPVLAHGGIGFACFGIDKNENDSLFSAEYALLTPLISRLAEWDAEGKTSALVEPEDHSSQSINLDHWRATVSFGTGRSPMRPNDQPIGKALIIQLDNNSFLVTGTLCRITFRPTGIDTGKAWQYLKVEKGSFENGAFQPQRILNGDETDWGGPAFGASPVWLRATLITR